MVSIIPIAMGCVGRCSYCVVKQARGELISYAPEKIREAVKHAVERGAKEIQITSQDCSAYGCERGDGFKLPELLALVTSVEGDFSVRVGMMNPCTISHILDALLEAFESEKIFKFFHVPVQSGSDKVLRDMRRGYKAADFIELVTRIRKRFADCTLCTDFIIGFPTETEEDFHASLKLLEEVKPEKVNITRFSPRPGTDAAQLKDLLDREKKRRSRIFSALERRIGFETQKALEGKELTVLITEKGTKGGVIGRDPAYRMVVLDEEVPLGASQRTRIREARGTYVRGEVVA
ncbi:MAG: tRNA (N(6)-L-threonylcarbamoyladenosine(37)-C(2))-methylthiotransferase [Methanophagales archaeon ANME-1-THS]|nr:MAG: tRNA (N(6)-L-threonylcarbamoyladenosine(37)-C(2))-methylthiotransferase [Methanophagales archaeon ANME-1-THS]